MKKGESEISFCAVWKEPIAKVKYKRKRQNRPSKWMRDLEGLEMDFDGWS